MHLRRLAITREDKQIPRQDGSIGTDEYWYVYPDGVALRKQVLWSSELDLEKHEWQETIVVNGPGQRPEDNIEADALTLLNMGGETHTYHWNPKTDDTFDYPNGPATLAIGLLMPTFRS